MNKPSSTITAATLAGMGATIIWELLATFTDVEPTAGLIAGTTVFVSSFFGFIKKEKVIK